MKPSEPRRAGLGLTTNVRGADLVTLPAADAVRAASGRGRPVAPSHGERDAGAAGPGTSAPGGPVAPTAVHGARPFSHHQALRPVTPL